MISCLPSDCFLISQPGKVFGGMGCTSSPACLSGADVQLRYRRSSSRRWPPCTAKVLEFRVLISVVNHIWSEDVINKHQQGPLNTHNPHRGGIINTTTIKSVTLKSEFSERCCDSNPNIRLQMLKQIKTYWMPFACSY